MKSIIPKSVEKWRIRTGVLKSDQSYGFNGAFAIPRGTERMLIIISDEGGWDHISVSFENRCPTWAEMCWIKKLFFAPDETAIQIHPPMRAYVNFHPFCLHMWRNQKQEFELPPVWMV